MVYREPLQNLHKNQDAIKNASRFSDAIYLTTFTALFDGRINTLSDEYEAGVTAMLKAHGIKTATKQLSGGSSESAQR